MGETQIEITEVYAERCQTSKMECFTKIVNVFQRITISTKRIKNLNVIKRNKLSVPKFYNKLKRTFNYKKVYYPLLLNIHLKLENSKITI